MANRVLRDCTNSDKVDKLSAEAERFFYRLMMKVDDFGSFYASPKLLNSNLFPLKENITTEEVAAWLSDCNDADLLYLYQVNGKYYVRIVDFGQRLRNMRGKFPHPPTNDGESLTNDNNPPPETKQKQNPKQETESETKKENLPQQIKSIELPFSSEAFALKWKEWIEYRSEIKQPYKSTKSIEAALKKLGKYSENFATMLISRSIENSWRGLTFEKTDLEFKNYKNEGTNKIITPGGGFGGQL